MPKRFAAAFPALAMAALTASPALAHLMVEQHGTLNVIENDVFMVLSLPVSAFDGLDDNGDGAVSMIEFNRHRPEIIQSVRDNVNLVNNAESCELTGLMLSPEVNDYAVRDVPAGAVSQIIVMGRYALSDAVGAIHFEIGLFGDHPDEQSLEIAATRIADHRNEVLELTESDTGGTFFRDRLASVDPN